MTCPRCGGVTETVTELTGEVFVAGGFATVGEDLPIRTRLTTFFACTACEWCCETDRVHTYKGA
jgi:hypothetical protein